MTTTTAFETTERYKTAQQMQSTLERSLVTACDLACMSDDAIDHALSEVRREFAAKLAHLREQWERGEL